jgi:hypothetical protein
MCSLSPLCSRLREILQRITKDTLNGSREEKTFNYSFKNGSKLPSDHQCDDLHGFERVAGRPSFYACDLNIEKSFFKLSGARTPM